MSLRLLRQLQAAHAFDPSPIRHDLGARSPFVDFVDGPHGDVIRRNATVPMRGDGFEPSHNSPQR